MTGSSSEQDLAAFYRRYIGCCNAHEFHRLGEFVAARVKVNGDVQSLPDYIRNLEAVVKAFPDYHWDVQHLLVDGEYVAAHFMDTGTHRGTFMGVEPTGRDVSTQEFAFYRVAADRIVEVWVAADNARLLQQLR